MTFIPAGNAATGSGRFVKASGAVLRAFCDGGSLVLMPIGLTNGVSDKGWFTSDQPIGVCVVAIIFHRC